MHHVNLQRGVDEELGYIPEHLRKYLVPTNNRVPDTVEAELKTLHSHLQSVQQETSHLDPSSVLWSQQYLERADVLDQLRIAVAPHKRLPRELLLEIFHYSVMEQPTVVISEDPNESRRSFTNDKLGMPLKLGHICSFWRDVAIGEPYLWNRIALHDPVRRHLPFFQTIMARCAQVPIEITIYASNFLNETIFTFIIPYSYQFSKLQLSGTENVMTRFLSLPYGSFSLLKEVTLRYVKVSMGIRITLPESGLRIFEGSPLLQKITLTSNSLLTVVPTSLITFQHLPVSLVTELELNAGIPFTSALQILQRSHNLIKCSLRIAGDDRTRHFTPQGVVVPHIRHLDIFFAESELGKIFFNSLTLPSLVHLSRTCPRGEEGFLWSPSSSDLRELFGRSDCRLAYLESLYIEDIGLILEALPDSLAFVQTRASFLRTPAMLRITRGEWKLPLNFLSCCVAWADREALKTMLGAHWSRESVRVDYRPEDVEEGQVWNAEFRMAMAPGDDHQGRHVLEEQISRLAERLGVRARVQISTFYYTDHFWAVMQQS